MGFLLCYNEQRKHPMDRDDPNYQRAVISATFKLAASMLGTLEAKEHTTTTAW